MYCPSPNRFFTCAILIAGSLFLSSPRAHGQSQTATPGGESHPILVELFTSEGCSSCPPADALLEKMDHNQPIPGAHLIVLSEHVTYWDHDGWKDPNSSPTLTDRQADYVHALGLSSPATPEFIVDGDKEMKPQDRDQVNKIFHDALATPKIPVRIDDVSAVAGNPEVLRTRIEADGNADKHDADVYVALALTHVESQVLHGENGGHHLTHVAVVQQLTKVGKLQKGKNFDQTVPLVLKPGTDPKNIRVVAFVQEHGPGKLLGAALWEPANSVAAATRP